MLVHLYIRNFAIIRELEVNFLSQMTCLTGETGAGKSIIIDSLELVLGGRADSSTIYPGTEKCEIIATFDVTNIPAAKNWLIVNEYGNTGKDTNECILRRTLTRDGRSKGVINGYPVTQQQMKTIGSLLISIHGQHENQSLLNQHYQLELLDSFAASQALAMEVRVAYYTVHDNKKKLSELEEQARDSEAKIELLQYQLHELDAVDSLIGKVLILKEEQKRLGGLEQFATNLNAALTIVSKNEHGSAIEALYAAKRHLDLCKNIDCKIEGDVELLQNSIIQLEELANSLGSIAANLGYDEETRREIEEQLNLIYTVARKHRVEPNELINIKVIMERQLASLQTIVSQMEELKEKVGRATDSYMILAEKLSKKRRMAADQLSKLVSAKLPQLAMAETRLVVNLVDNLLPLDPTGLEQVEFLVSINPGHPLLPLNKVASGGELSRISLAIQVITATGQVTPTLIFDEVDAGIGGKTAEIIGRLLHQLSGDTQIICITHLPQIASQAHSQMSIEKRIVQGHTELKLTVLEQNERTKEIARMLGGIKITKQTLAHAEEMLKNN